MAGNGSASRGTEGGWAGDVEGVEADMTMELADVGTMVGCIALGEACRYCDSRREGNGSNDLALEPTLPLLRGARGDG